jgi:translation initiation factor eIF-2B subunit epsilon
MAESFGSKFKPMSNSLPKCLFPLANTPMILYTLEFLAMNDVKEVFLVSSWETKLLRDRIDYVREYHKIGKQSSLKITYIKLESAQSLAEGLREVNDAVELRDEFILCQGDIVCNADLSDALKFHYRSKQEIKDRQTIMTKVFARIPFTSATRDSS